MDYEERYTDRKISLGEESSEIISYIPRVYPEDKDVVLERLGQYEDLGFSPLELAEMLLDSDKIDSDRKELLILAKKRTRRFDSENFRLLFPEKEITYFSEE